MPLLTEIIPFTLRSGIGVQTVNHVRYPTMTAKAIIFASADQFRPGQAFLGYGAYGFGVDDGVMHIGNAFSYSEVVGVCISERIYSAEYSILATQGSTGFGGSIPQLKGYVSAIAAGSFDITLDLNGVSGSFWYAIVIGGNDVSCKVGIRNLADGAGDVLVGFDPVALLVLGVPGSSTGAVAGALNNYGFATPCNQVQVAWGIAGGTINSDAKSFQVKDIVKAEGDAGAVPGSTPTPTKVVTGYVANGFTIDGSAFSGFADSNIGYLAIGGAAVSANLIAITQPAATSSQLSAVIANDPVLALFASTDHVKSSTVAVNASNSFGASDGVSQFAVWAGQLHGQPFPYAHHSQWSNDVAFWALTPTGAGFSTTASYASCTLSANAIALDWTVVDPIRREVWALVLANNPVPEVPLNPCGTVIIPAEDNCGCVIPPDGDVVVIAEVDLPDRVDYHHGFKEGILVDVGEAQRSLSDDTGRPETSNCEFSLFDQYGAWRARLADPDPAIAELKGLYVALYGISDQQRRLESLPTLLFRGAIAEYNWTTDLQLRITVENYLSCLLQSIGDQSQVPRFAFSPTDFPNCAVDKVAPGSRGYRCSGGAASGATTMAVTGGSGVFASRATFQIGGVGAEYSVTLGSSADPETAITFSPALVADVADGATLIFKATYDVDPANLKRVPFAYGYITDRFLIDGFDVGDGRAPLTYVGDRILPDGQLWGEFVWVGHRCHSPGGRPIDMLYFFSEPLGETGSGGTWYFDSGQYNPEPLDVETAVGGRILLPGWPGWVAMGFGTGYNGSYRTYNGHEYTTIFLRSLYRDVALGIMGNPANLGGAAPIMRASAYGWGDGHGNLLNKAGAIYLHVLQNYLLGAWRGGPTLPTPSFPDGVPAIDEASFARADAVAARRTPPSGCQFDFLVGYGDEVTSKTELIQRMNRSFDVQSGENEDVQFAIYMEEDDPYIALADVDTLDDVNDIHNDDNQFALSFRADLVTNAVRIFNTRQYPGGTDWLFGHGNDGLFTNDDSIRQQCIILAPELELWMIRAKWRDIEPDYYQPGTDWTADLAQRRLRRTATAPVIDTVPTGLRATGPAFKLGNDCMIEHFRNIGGRTARPMRIERIRVRPGSNNNGRVVILEGSDQSRILST